MTEPKPHHATKHDAALANLDDLVRSGRNGRGGEPLHEDVKAVLAVVASICRQEYASRTPAATPDALRERLERDFASAFIRIRGAHSPDPGEPCAWCRLAAEQATEAVLTTGIRATLASPVRPEGLDALLDPENAPAVHGSWKASSYHHDRDVELVDDDNCSLWVEPEEVAALVNFAIARPSDTTEDPT